MSCFPSIPRLNVLFFIPLEAECPVFAALPALYYAFLFPARNSTARIDISPKTIRRARENLRHCQNITLICDDFTTHVFREKYDVIYSTLTMMHFQDKSLVIGKISALLNDGGLICLSIDKNQSEWLDMGNRRIRIYPDTPERIMALAEQVGLKTKKVVEIENAHIVVLVK